MSAWRGLCRWLLLAAVCPAAPSTASPSAAGGQDAVWIVHLSPRLRADDLSPTSLGWSPQERAQRRQDVYRLCEERVKNAQEHASAFILGQEWGSAVAIERVWIQNALIVRIRSSETHRALDSTLFFTDSLRWLPGVTEVERDGDAGISLIIPSTEDIPSLHVTQHIADEPQKNIRLLHAPELWKKGVEGEGVTIASIDSGVRYTHDALYQTFRGRVSKAMASERRVTFDYSFWFPSGTDVNKETPDTADEVGHGTHTVGTAVGQLGIGVAPKATWIAARAFDLHGAVKKSDFLLATQWVLCPTKVDGSHKNCSLGADVITGSFGVDRSDVETYKQWTWITHILQVWRAAGSYAVFASGNTNGFKCGSVYYPANREESVAVGALIGGYTLWGASGKGPSIEDDEENGKMVIKPDFVAPGAAIRSALSTADSAYTRMTGTSMAAPHLTGLLALLLSAAHKSKSFLVDADLLDSLRSTSSHELSKPFLVPSKCGNTSYNQYPNNIYGSGLPDVCAAAKKAFGIECVSTSTDRVTTNELMSVE
ncbi:hypothetical protein Poli38472_013131 [Pythium oligandrum]|uniref:subtilisin n=1 Tax=Pythium oligandrum TaxID=41045 RepID=A0A8K1C2H1_PYTOL|nr:hypothetical protein Poli38472_013131 [Pythium oligandrum]|eukprot:TMW55240.1 hypothetical protein Poli38472_013131 [Pythium oligandrum]